MHETDPGRTISGTSAAALLERLDRTLAHEIPISAALGIRPLRYDGLELTLAAPLAPNLNHKQTAFGGSLYCAAVLAGWGLLHLQWLRSAGTDEALPQIVIQEANIDYRRAVDGDFEAVCRWPVGLDPQRIARMLERRGRARAELEVRIGPEADPAIAFAGRYVLLSGNHARPMAAG